MQRVLKYHLILRELMSNTAATHEEYHLIQQAYEAMLDVSDYINEVRAGEIIPGRINHILAGIFKFSKCSVFSSGEARL